MGSDDSVVSASSVACDAPKKAARIVASLIMETGNRAAYALNLATARRGDSCRICLCLGLP